MDKKVISCPSVLANALIQLGYASDQTPSKPEPKPEPVKNLWHEFVSAVKRSSLTDAMKVACVAQAIQESGRGTSRVSKELLNFHGMKFRETLEGLAVPVRIEVKSETKGWDIFAKFSSLDFEIQGWVKFLSREYYIGWEEHKDDTEAFIRHIGKAWCPRADYVDVVLAHVAEAKGLLMLVSHQDTKPSGKVLKIFLDPGHSEKRTGARSNDRTAEEEDLNRLQVNIIKKGLELTGLFQCTIFDPIDDDLSAVGRAAKGHDMAIHAHHNSYSGNGDPGVECLYDNDKAEAQSKKFAELVCAKISKALGCTNRGAKPFSGTVMDVAEQQGTFPVILTESYFLNPYTKEQAEKRSTIAAEAMTEAIMEWFSVKDAV
jgi:N-acetylmuramoyl-L-alanine amidase